MPEPGSAIFSQRGSDPSEERETVGEGIVKMGRKQPRGSHKPRYFSRLNRGGGSTVFSQTQGEDASTQGGKFQTGGGGLGRPFKLKARHYDLPTLPGGDNELMKKRNVGGG